MNLQKNWFSYFLFGIFSILTIVGIMVVGMPFWTNCLKLNGISAAYLPWVVTGVMVALMAFFYFLLHLILFKNRLRLEINLGTRTALECIVALLLFAGAIFYKVYFLFYGYQGLTGDKGFYFLNAMVKSDVVKQEVTNGSANAYIAVLSGLFSLFGNKEDIVFCFQIILQLITFVLLYFAIRMLCSRITALLALGILVFSDTFCRMTMDVGPGVFYLFLWSMGLFFIAVFYKITLKRGWYHDSFGEIGLFLLAMYIGIISYWDILGILLIPIMIYAFIQANHGEVMLQLFEELQRLQDAEKERNRQKRERKKEIRKMKKAGVYFTEEASIEIEDTKTVMEHGTQIFIIVAGILFGLFCTIMKYTGMTGLFFKEQCISWIQNYAVKVAPRLQFPQDNYVILCIIAVGCICFIPGFIRCKMQAAEPWIILSVCGSIVLPVLNLEFVDQKMFVLLFWAVMTGQGIQLLYQNIWNHEEAELYEEPDEIWEATEPTEPAKHLLPATEEPTEPIEDTEHEKVEEKPVRYIENPLPVPKKHVKKEMDYTYGIKENELEFDTEVKPDDDFDY